MAFDILKYYLQTETGNWLAATNQICCRRIWFEVWLGMTCYRLKSTSKCLTSGGDHYLALLLLPVFLKLHPSTPSQTRTTTSSPLSTTSECHETTPLQRPIGMKTWRCISV
ncbi:unnamed protein product [Coffea canephora]|uniref:DH200=94 genomic scaffold, scaffold_67 n=1 Tax=Coffea canephora TaxID=49390 RepID=A0A068UW00_COFCA|nr:unnamed protein product [Coffea canephora]